MWVKDILEVNAPLFNQQPESVEISFVMPSSLKIKDRHCWYYKIVCNIAKPITIAKHRR